VEYPRHLWYLETDVERVDFDRLIGPGFGAGNTHRLAVFFSDCGQSCPVAARGKLSLNFVDSAQRQRFNLGGKSDAAGRLNLDTTVTLEN